MPHRCVLLGVTGSVAIIKSLFLLRLLAERGYQVKVIMTAAAQRFVRPLSFISLGAVAVHTDDGVQGTVDRGTTDIEHIALARWAQLIVVAPASANTLAKLAHGQADDLLGDTLLAAEIPVALAPAMNQAMYKHPAVYRNRSLLSEDGVLLWGPGKGDQACGESGYGRMLEAEELLCHIEHFFQEQCASC